jgi:DNA-binding CsgD family transcriptional regulator
MSAVTYGNIYGASVIGLRLVDDSGGRLGQQIAPHLSERQLQVLRLVARGCTDREVAEVLGISPRTARMHVDALRLKLKVERRRELFARYRDLGGADLLAIRGRTEATWRL